MTTRYGAYDAHDVMYDKNGVIVDASAQADLIAYLKSPQAAAVTDFVMMSHGWNNDVDDARTNLYGPFFTALGTALADPTLAWKPSRTFAVGTIFWPSKKFANTDMAASIAASLDTGTDATALNAQLDRLHEAYAGDPAAVAAIEHARTLVPHLELSATAQDEFVASLESALPPVRGERDEGLDDAREAVSGMRGRDVLDRLSDPIVLDTPADAPGGAAGFDPGAPAAGDQVTAAGLFGLSGGILSSAAMLANLFTYYTMKDRAGVVGRGGAVQTLQAVMAARPDLTIHLVGHSFGGRLVTAVANALPAGSSVESILLLEAAYSHNGIASKWDGTNDGSFRGVVSAPKVKRAMLITHSSHDWPVGMGYPLASRVMNQVAQAFGGPEDKFGGMGRNGAQHTPESFDDVLMPLGHAYGARPAGTFIRNLKGDGTDPGSVTIGGHGDVSKPEIAYAWLGDIK